MEFIIKPLNSIIVILIVGGLVFLSFLLMSNPLKVNKKANLFFGIFAFLWASFWFEEVLFLTASISPNYWIDFILTLLHIFASVLFYYSVLYFTNPHYKFSTLDLLHLIIPFWVLLSFIVELDFHDYFNYRSIFVVSILLQALFYITNSFIHLQKHEKRIELFNSSREAVDLKWIKQIIYALFSISILITLYNLMFPGSRQLNILANFPMLIMIFYVAYQSIAQKEIFILDKEEIKQIIEEKDTNTKSKPQLIPKDKLHTYKENLVDLMEKEKPYLEGELSLAKLAKLIELSPHHLSYLLNEGFGKNFFQFVNAYRVEEAKKLLLSEAHQHLSIIGIAYEAGFNSKTAFNTVFKNNTGMTPTVYKKNALGR